MNARAAALTAAALTAAVLIGMAFAFSHVLNQRDEARNRARIEHCHALQAESDRDAALRYGRGIPGIRGYILHWSPQCP